MVWSFRGYRRKASGGRCALVHKPTTSRVISSPYPSHVVAPHLVTCRFGSSCVVSPSCRQVPLALCSLPLVPSRNMPSSSPVWPIRSFEAGRSQGRGLPVRPPRRRLAHLHPRMVLPASGQERSKRPSHEPSQPSARQRLIHILVSLPPTCTTATTATPFYTSTAYPSNPPVFSVGRAPTLQAQSRQLRHTRHAPQARRIPHRASQAQARSQRTGPVSQSRSSRPPGRQRT